MSARRREPRDRTERTVIFDTEAIHLLASPAEKPEQSRRLLAAIEGHARRNRAGIPAALIVPTAVRAEARWNRAEPGSAGLNRYRIRDFELGGAEANTAAAIRMALGSRISVADAHIGAVLAATATNAPHTVYTSDQPDVRDIAAHVGVPVTLPPL